MYRFASALLKTHTPAAVLLGTLITMIMATPAAYGQFLNDSIPHNLPEVVVTAPTPREVIPGQKLSGPQLQNLSTFSVADAIRYFSGVQIKDYGGIGGVKTINVRSMGTNHMGIFYNGVQLGNAQNGQIDLGRFSLDNVEEISLYNGQKSNIFQGAKDYGSAGTVYITTKYPTFEEGKKYNLRVGLKGGSFGLISPSVTWEQRLPLGFSMSATTELTSSHGRYPFRYKRIFQDGTVAYDTTAVRENGDITALRAELALYHTLPEGAWDLHGYYYRSNRGLPGPIVKNVFEHGQRLHDESYFVQSKYNQRVTDHYRLKVNAKYANDYTRYIDKEWTSPIYVDNRYLQHELYASVANLFELWDWLKFNFAVDYQLNIMQANLINFSQPTRNTVLTALAAEAKWRWFTLQVSGLGTFVRDRVKMNESAPKKDIFTPAVVLSVKPFEHEEFFIEAFYKDIFRMPTFNDLYYTFIGNATLRPEYATQYNLGLRYAIAPNTSWLSALELKLDTYYNKVTDKIVAVPAGNMFRWMMLNLGKVDIKGLELTANALAQPTKDLSLSGQVSYTYQDARYVTNYKDKNYKHQIVYIPRHSGSVIASADYKSWGMNYSFIYTGERFNAKYNDDNSRMLPWYTHDLSFRKLFRFDHRYSLRVSLDINNLLNQHYDVVLNYPMPGRNYKMTLLFKM